MPWKSPRSNTGSPSAVAGSADEATQYGIAEGLGDVLMLQGRYGEAGELFQAALDLAEGTFAEAQIRGKLGELDFKRGDMASAALAFEDALRLLGRPVPQKTRRLRLHAAVGGRGPGSSTRCFPRLFVGRRDRAPSKPELLRLRLLSRLAYAYWFTRGRCRRSWCICCGMNLAERYRADAGTGPVYSAHAMAMTLIGWYRPRHRLRAESRWKFGDRWATFGARDNR